MQIARGLIASTIVIALFTVVLRCASKGVGEGAAITETYAEAAAMQQAAAARAQNDAMYGGGPVPGAALGSVGPGETWRGSFTIKLPPESFSLTGSPGVGGASLYRDLRFKLLQNDWQAHGVSGRVDRVHTERYNFDIWHLERDGRMLIPRVDNPEVDMEALGRLSREEFLRLKWKRDPQLDKFQPEWDLRRGSGSAHRATIVVTVTAPPAAAEGRTPPDVTRGELYFGSNRQGIGLVLTLRYDAATGGFWIAERSPTQGGMVANPHYERFADAY